MMRIPLYLTRKIEISRDAETFSPTKVGYMTVINRNKNSIG